MIRVSQISGTRAVSVQVVVFSLKIGAHFRVSTPALNLNHRAFFPKGKVRQAIRKLDITFLST